MVKGGASATNDLQTILKQMQESGKENKGSSGGRGKKKKYHVTIFFTSGLKERIFCLQSEVFLN